MEHIFDVLCKCEELDRIPVDDLSFAVAMLSEIGVKQKQTEFTRQLNIDCLDQMYQYWYK